MSLIELKVPTIGESITEVTLTQWLKPNGSFIKLDDTICEFESDKATLEFPSEAEGKLIYVAEEGQDLKIGDVVAKIDTSFKNEGLSSVEEPAKPKILENKVESASYALGSASPSASKILAEKNISPSEVKGSGKDGRIIKEDAIQANSATPTSNINIADKNSRNASDRNQHIEKMSRMRRTIAKRLVSAKNTTAMLTTFNEVDMTAMNDLRAKYQDLFVAKYGIKLGYMSLFAKACSIALLEFPDVNAYIEDENIIYNDFVDISVAISTPTGLVVPPILNVEKLGFHEIEQKIKILAEKARLGKLSLDEMKGGTFTITNGGIFGSMLSTPIINEPQSAILGMHAIINRPVAINNEVKIRPMMYLALSYDHRIIDGSTSVTFLVKVKKLLEDPTLMFMRL